MPNWKKVIVSGSDAVLNEITASSDVLFEGGLQLEGQLNAGANIVPQTDNIGSVGTSALTFNNGRFTNFTVDSTLTVSSITVSSGISNVPQVIATSGFVQQEDIQRAYVPWTNVNVMDEFTTTGYWRFFTPYDGYIKEIIVHPHTSATSGTCTINAYKNGSSMGTEQETISGTVGTATTFSFGSSSYSFSDGDYLNLNFDRESPNRSTGFSFTIVLMMDSTT